MPNYKLRFLVALVLIPILLLASDRTAAQIDNLGLELKPAISEQVVTAGQLSIVPITVSNITSFPQAVSVSFQPLAPIDPVIDESARARYDATSWLSVESPDLLLGPGESEIVKIRISPPTDAGPGGHYAHVVFRVLNQTPLGNGPSNTLVSPELTSVLFLTVPGDINEIAEASYTSPSLLSQAEARSFDIDLVNRGTVHLLPSANVSIVQLGGQEVEKLTVPSKLSIPGTQSNLRAEWHGASPGVYQARYVISYGSPTKQLVHTSNWFIVLPALWIQLVVLASLILFIRLTLPPLYRRFRKKRLRLGRDLTGEPNINIHREITESTDMSAKRKGKFKKR